MDAQEMIARAIQRYGGRPRWERLRLTLAPTSLRGLVPWMKGAGRTFRLPARADIVPSRAEATFFDYGPAGGPGRFQNGRVALDDAPLAEHRSTFRGLRKWRRWSPLDGLYFFGYALTHYHSVPFTLAEAEVRAWNPARRALTVAFAPTVHTHCRVQTFYFDETGLIVRHDYVADIVGAVARGAHFWREVEDVDGFPVARHRRVVLRLGTLPTPLVALDARLAPPQVNYDA
ncbi:MAG TPA: hypothetical protein VN962_23145 [Polyangia bacterium]|nr:hypothetical protein [Polyangia bacterium]